MASMRKGKSFNETASVQRKPQYIRTLRSILVSLCTLNIIYKLKNLRKRPLFIPLEKLRIESCLQVKRSRYCWQPATTWRSDRIKAKGAITAGLWDNPHLAIFIRIAGLLIFRGKKRKISRDFQGQIRGKIGRFRGIFAEKKSKFAEKSADFAGYSREKVKIRRKIGRFPGF